MAQDPQPDSQVPAEDPSVRMRFRLDSFPARAKAWLHAMLVEHNFTNLLRFNFHRISPECFRSSQPTMWQLRRVVRKYGIKTIINLKGANEESAYWAFEREQCAKLGVRLVDVKIASRGFPSHARLQLAHDVFASVEYPIWIHCKAGIDRTGIYATLYQHFRLGMPIEQTDQLRLWPYGHIRRSKAGKAGYFLEQYARYHREHPEVGLLEWSRDIADREQMEREFRASGLASFLNDRLLRRE